MYLYPKWIRAWHVLNAVLFIVLIITGLNIHFADGVSTYESMKSPTSVRWHNFASVLLIINYIVYVTGNVLTKNGKYYRIASKGFIGDLYLQFRYYLYGMFRGEKRPFPVSEEQKFNPLQKFSYVIAMYIVVPLVILSGIALFLPDLSLTEIFTLSGSLFMNILHISTGFFLLVFVIIHIYSCTLGSKPTSLFTGIITGYHVSDED